MMPNLNRCVLLINNHEYVFLISLSQSQSSSKQPRHIISYRIVSTFIETNSIRLSFCNLINTIKWNCISILIWLLRPHSTFDIMSLMMMMMTAVDFHIWSLLVLGIATSDFAFHALSHIINFVKLVFKSILATRTRKYTQTYTKKSNATHNY